MKKFEFCYRDSNMEVHFVTVYDDDIVSACERVLCRDVDPIEISGSAMCWFIKGWENTNFSVKELRHQPSSHVIYTPESFNPILAGLV